MPPHLSSIFFFFNDTATTEIYTLSLHDALPIFSPGGSQFAARFLASVNFPSLLPALDNVLVGALVVSRLLAQRRESPGRLRMIALDLTFAASVRVIHRVHGHAANRRPNPAPTCAAGLSEGFVLMEIGRAHV